jgi:phosphatidylglycerophosphate synthase
MFAAFVDHADGELARLVNKTSTFGHYYDHVAAAVSYVSLFVGMGIGQHYGPLGNWGMFLGAAAGVTVAVIMGMRVEIEVREGMEAVKQGSIAGFEPEDILYMVGPVIWLGYGLPFLVVAGIGAPLFLLWVAWGRVRNLRGRNSRGQGQS